MYRLIKNTRKRGRLPDMKPFRVTLSASVVAVLLGFVFFAPLPVTRIRERGFVQVQPTAITQVAVEVPGILQVIHVKEGERVKKGKLLAEFFNYDLEKQRDLALAQMESRTPLIRAYDEQIAKEPEGMSKNNLREQRARAEAELRQAEANYKHIVAEIARLSLRAPRDGVVIGLPSIDEVGKGWDREQTTVFCAIGDETKLRVLAPLSPADYDLLRENYNKATPQKPLLATIRVQGHGERTWAGKISQLPTAAARTIPLQLSTKGGGPLAVKPHSSLQQLEPQGQYFLVGIDLLEPDTSIVINAHAQVKIHCEYRSLAWWIHRSVASAFDLGLIW